MGAMQQVMLSYGASINTNCQPTDYSGAKGWFDATATCLPGLADGGAVGSTTNWIDAGFPTTGNNGLGQPRNWSQGTAGARPTLHTTSGPNGQPWISFDGGDGLGFSNTASNLESAVSNTFFWVIRPQQAGGGSHEFGPVVYTHGGYCGLTLFDSGGSNKFQFYQYNAGYVDALSTTTYSTNTWYIVEAWWDGVNINIKVNNDTTVSSAIASIGSTANTPSMGNNCTMDIAGEYFWNVDIGSTNRTAFRNCLAARFGITLAP